MRFLALDTNIGRVKGKFMSPDERELMTASFHGLKFFSVFFLCGVLTVIIISIAGGAAFFSDIPLAVIAGVISWMILVFPTVLRAFIDWKYDFVVITTDKVVIVDQSSLFKQRITPINLENVTGVSTETQFWNLFDLGTLHLDLNESGGAEHTLRYVAHAHDVASAVTEALTNFQRRKDLRRYPHGEVQDLA